MRIPVPDITFYLDIDPSIGIQRALKQQRLMDRMETERLAFHEAVRQGFLEIAKKEPNRMVVIDASLSEDEVFEKVSAAFLIGDS